MSLLIKALEQAAKDRKAGRAAGNAPNPAPEAGSAHTPASAAAPRGSVEPTLEPTLDPPPQRRTPARAGEPRPAAPAGTASPSRAPVSSAASGSLSLDSPAAAAPRRVPSSLATLAASDAQQQQRARAATVMQASGKSSHAIAWLRANPVAMVGGAAVLFGLAFGIYVYLQIAAPGVFVRQASSPPPQVPPSTPAPGAPMAGMPETPPAPPSTVSAAETERVLAPPGTQPVGPAASSGSIAPAAAAAAPGGPIPSASIVGAAPQAAEPRGVSAAEIRRERGTLRPAEPSSDAPGAISVTPSARARPSVAAEAPSAGRERVSVSATAVQPRLNPTLSQAYSQLQAGNVDQARASYNTLLQSEPHNIDAMLGLAYIATQENRADDATKFYLRILQLNPRHATAQGALIGLMGRADPIASETRLKQLIAREPSPFLHFILGNVYADQSQWPQAQQSYFQAHHLEPENPDYAYNLAVGLDHIRQPKPALNFYRRAEQLATAQGRSNFNVSHARERIRALSSQLE
jgi:Tfp pilus assembly protein PilF